MIIVDTGSSCARSSPLTETNECPARRTDLSIISLLILWFVATRLLYWFMGVRFDMTALDYGWQILDPQLLRHDLLSSLYYLHSQPPLFNLFLGLVLKIFPGFEPMALSACYKLLGMAICLCLYVSMARLGISKAAAFTVAAIYIASPQCVLYENWPLYTYPVACMLCISVVSLQSYLRVGDMTRLWVFSIMTVCIALTRSIFHLTWVMAVFGLVWFLIRGRRRAPIWAAIVPLAILLSFYGKSLLQFGTFSLSSWLGMNLHRKAIAKTFSKSEIQRMADRGIVSGLSPIDSFSRPEAYERLIGHTPSKGIPALDATVKSSGYINYNHVGYLTVSKRLTGDSCAAIYSFPYSFLRATKSSVACFFLPASHQALLWNNLQKINWVDRLYDSLFYWPAQVGLSNGVRTKEPVRILLIGAYLVVGIYGLFVAWGVLRGTNRDRSGCIILLYMWFTVVYVAVLGNLTELGENNRFRFTTEPFALILLVAAVKDAVSRLSEKLGISRTPIKS